MNNYIGVTAYAMYFDLSPETVRRLCREGKIPGAVQPGGYAGSWRIPITALNVTDLPENGIYPKERL